MDDCSDHALKTICCTCLSRDRKLMQLCKLADGVNNLYNLLSYDTEAYREGFYKDTSSLFICWECQAVMTKITKFRSQACSVQKLLTDIAEERIDVKFQNTCLSQLSITSKLDYDDIISEDGSIADNFIDCGPVVKSEDELDDIALSELHNNYISDKEEFIGQAEEVSIRKLKPKVKMKKKRKKKLKNGLSCNRHKFENETDGERTHRSMERKKVTMNDAFLKAPFKCELCVDVFNSQIKMDEHIAAMHSKSNIKLQTSVSKRRRTHSIENPTPNGYICPECNKCFDTKNKRWKHVQRYHREGHACHTCGKKFAFKNNLNRHEQLHIAPAPREECPHCHKQIRSDLLKVHVRIHSVREQFSCAECDKRFVSRASYDHHLKYTQAHAANTTVILKYKCSMCDKGYRSRGELRDHVNYQHMGKTQHKCPVCGKALATRRCITRHVRRAHDGVKESARDKICQQCGKAFRDKKGLREHEFIHTGERPLSCEICGCTFRQSASLYTHRKRVHKIYPEKKNVELLDAS